MSFTYIELTHSRLYNRRNTDGDIDDTNIIADDQCNSIIHYPKLMQQSTCELKVVFIGLWISRKENRKGLTSINNEFIWDARSARGARIISCWQDDMIHSMSWCEYLFIQKRNDIVVEKFDVKVFPRSWRRQLIRMRDEKKLLFIDDALVQYHYSSIKVVMSATDSSDVKYMIDRKNDALVHENEKFRKKNKSCNWPNLHHYCDDSSLLHRGRCNI